MFGIYFLYKPLHFDRGAEPRMTDAHDLETRFHMMEADRNSYAESSQRAIKEKQDMIANLRREHADLLEQLGNVRNVEAHPSYALKKECARLEAQYQNMTRAQNLMEHSAQEKKVELQSLQDTLHDVEKELEAKHSESTPAMKTLQEIESRVDEAVRKFNETANTQKTYQKIQERLLHDKIEHEKQLQAIESTLETKRKSYEELVKMTHDATHSRDLVKQEITKYSLQLQEESKMRAKELAQRRIMVKTKKLMAERVLKRAAMRTEMTLVAKGDLTSEQEKKLKKTAVAQTFDSLSNDQKLHDVNKKIAAYEDALHSIKEVTGLDSVEGILNRFHTCQETTQSLDTHIQSLEERVQNLKEEELELKHRVKLARVEGGTTEFNRRILDEKESVLSEQTAIAELSQQKYTRIANILVDVVAGIQHLSKRLTSISLPNAKQGPIDVTEDTLIAALEESEAKLLRLVELISKGDDGGRNDSVDRRVTRLQRKLSVSALPSTNFRVSLPGSQLGIHDESPPMSPPLMIEDEDEELVLDRADIKRISSHEVNATQESKSTAHRSPKRKSRGRRRL